MSTMSVILEGQFFTHEFPLKHFLTFKDASVFNFLKIVSIPEVREKKFNPKY